MNSPHYTISKDIKYDLKYKIKLKIHTPKINYEMQTIQNMNCNIWWQKSTDEHSPQRNTTDHWYRAAKNSERPYL